MNIQYTLSNGAKMKAGLIRSRVLKRVSTLHKLQRKFSQMTTIQLSDSHTANIPSALSSQSRPVSNHESPCIFLKMFLFGSTSDQAIQA